MKLDGFDDVVSLSAITGGLVVTQPTKISLLDDNYEVIPFGPLEPRCGDCDGHAKPPTHDRRLHGW